MNKNLLQRLSLGASVIVLGLLVSFANLASAERTAANFFTDVGGIIGLQTSTDVFGSATKPLTTINVATTTTTRIVGFGIPTVATSTGAGVPNATSTLQAGSNDMGGVIQLITGSNPAIKATIATFSAASSTQQFCIVVPANAITSATSTNFFVATTSNGFSLVASTTPLTATSTYQWIYNCH